MKRVSLGAAWLETTPFIRREAALLLPVALLFLAVPLALMFYAVPPELRQMQLDPGAPRPTVPAGSVLAILLCLLAVMGGTLILYALALKPGISLREALGLAVRRLPVALGAALIAGVAVLVPVVLTSAIAPRLGAVAMLIGAAVVSIRLLLINAVVVDRPVGVIEALRTGWTMTKGQAWRLALFLVVVTLAITLAQFLGNVMLGLIGFAIGGKGMALETGNIGAAIALALGQLYLIVMIARMYRQLSA